MYFVDEEHGFVECFQFGQDGLEPLFHLAFVRGPRHQRTHVQLQQCGSLKLRRHFSGHNLPGQPFHQRGFAHARFAHDEHVGLEAAAQDFEELTRFAVAAHNGVQFPVAGGGGAVGAVFKDRFGRFVRRRGGALLARSGPVALSVAAHGLLQHGLAQGQFEQLIFGEGKRFKLIGRKRQVGFGHGRQHRQGTEGYLAEFHPHHVGHLQQGAGGIVGAGVFAHTGRFGAGFDPNVGPVAEVRHVDVPAYQLRGQPHFVVQDTGQQMAGGQRGVLIFAGNGLRNLHSLTQFVGVSE